MEMDLIPSRVPSALTWVCALQASLHHFNSLFFMHVFSVSGKLFPPLLDFSSKAKPELRALMSPDCNSNFTSRCHFRGVGFAWMGPSLSHPLPAQGSVCCLEAMAHLMPASRRLTLGVSVTARRAVCLSLCSHTLPLFAC